MLHGWFTTQTSRRPEAVSARSQAILLVFSSARRVAVTVRWGGGGSAMACC